MTQAAEHPQDGRSDAFTAARKSLFLTALMKGEAVLAACALVGISNRTAYNHRESDAEFARYWDLAVSRASMPLELIAWERAIGVEEPVYAYGKFSHMRRRASDTLLRKMLEAELPKKYGRPRRTRKALVAAERKRIRKEIEEEMAAEMAAGRQAGDVPLCASCAGAAPRPCGAPDPAPGVPAGPDGAAAPDAPVGSAARGGETVNFVNPPPGPADTPGEAPAAGQMSRAARRRLVRAALRLSKKAHNRELRPHRHPGEGRAP